MAFLFLSFFSGCHGELMRKNAESNRMENDINLKQRQLNELNRQNDSLAAEAKRLKELHEKTQANFEALSSDIERLRKQNAETKAVTAIQREKQKAINASIPNYTRRMSDLRTNNQLTDEEKNERILRLRKEIKTRLEVGLQ